MSLSVVVLAAGEGKRFRSAVPKPLHVAAGRPLLWHVLAAAGELQAERTVVVVGRGADEVRSAANSFGLGPLQFAVQQELRGTGDALASALPLLGEEDGEVLVLYGDTPLLTNGTLQRLLAAHRASGAGATILTARLRDPTGYGRVLRGEDGEVTGVVEERDATAEQRAIEEANVGFYVFRRPVLDGLSRLAPDNDQAEYYLPDLIPLLLADGGRVATSEAPEHEVLGVNDRAQLAQATAVLRRRTLERVLAAGVTVTDPATTYLDVDVEVGQDTVLEPLTFLEAGTRVGAGCVIGPNTRLVACTVDDEATVTQAVGVHAHVGARATVGPFAYLRPGAELGPGSKVGTYVEVKKSSIGRGSKVPHLTYVGDAEIGEDVNVGAGTVFVNYDGRTKHRTVVGTGAFIGSDTMLVAPLSIGDGAQTAAGSTITKDVPAGALAIERAVQRIVKGWAQRRGRHGEQAERRPTGDHEESEGSGSLGGG
jgi:bifunctional UDP-N-acetylglucosamine pyrophosphorylase/glucosamine-1-phosphate N-acetyltransferase